MMAKTTKEIIAQAISDFDNIEKAFEECGLDIPYDTDTSEYGDKIRELYHKAMSEGLENVDIIYGGDALGNA